MKTLIETQTGSNKFKKIQIPDWNPQSGLSELEWVGFWQTYYRIGKPKPEIREVTGIWLNLFHLGLELIGLIGLLAWTGIKFLIKSIIWGVLIGIIWNILKKVFKFSS